ncbi:DoxX family protein [Nocardia halotolerans]|uniref:DoxX family protein n=1 Tax=Nocardia halotolerans TaxID=1755878 RepID=A0ABV8VJ65_9NOCA
MPIRPVRRIARTLLGTTFVASGVNGLMNPKPRAAAASALADKGRDSLPDQLAAKVPDDPSRVVQVNAMAQVAGGVLLAIGRAPRPAAFVLAATVVPGTVTEQDFWAESDPDLKAVKRAGFLKDLGLLGGLLIASADTEGKPSLGWRGRRVARKLVDRSPTLAEQARDEGVVIIDAAKSRGSQLAEVARDRGPQWAEAARDRGEHLAELARERAPQLAEAARDRGSHLAEVARDRGPQLADAARGRGEHFAERARERAPQLADTARDRGSHFAEVAKDRAETARERGTEAAEVARRRGSKAADRARERANAAAETARERGVHAAELAEDRKAHLADGRRRPRRRLARSAADLADLVERDTATTASAVRRRAARWS